MTDPTLTANQWSLGDLKFGRSTGIEVTDFDYGGKPDTNAGDVSLPGEDGIRFGYDTLGSRTLTLELLVNQYGAEEGRAAWRALSAVWNSQSVRSKPGAVTYLRMNLPGNSGPLRAYGRPRKFSAVTSKNWVGVNSGAIQIAADFVAADDKFYSDTEVSNTLSLVPDTAGGFTWDITWPVYFQPGGARSDLVFNDGESATWPVFEFQGPIANPEVGYVGTDLKLKLATSLTAGEKVTIDTRPWVRTVTTDAGGSYAGYLTGNRMSEMALPTGQTEIAFRGTDNTGTARCTIRFRSAYSTP
ncbi:phage tail family protein [Streptomyces phaeochromogenes]|uniref:hypothetical protein n=1 Tax=Streptomyces phaeochromogenes TaxID=1923 RepID=UPI002E2E7E05|nr:hypothetical protein [Streptomyces phaeochromogenes]